MIRMRPPKSKSRSCLVCLMNRPQVLPSRPIIKLAAVVHGALFCWRPRRLCRIIHLRERQTKGKIVSFFSFFIGRTRSANWRLLFKSAADPTCDTIKIRLKPSVRPGPSTDEMKSLKRQLSRWPKNLVYIFWFIVALEVAITCYSPLLCAYRERQPKEMTRKYERAKKSIHVVWASPNWSVDRFEASHGAAKLLLTSVSAAAVDNFFTC